MNNRRKMEIVVVVVVVGGGVDVVESTTGEICSVHGY
jgi:hypothetical protein